MPIRNALPILLICALPFAAAAPSAAGQAAADESSAAEPAISKSDLRKEVFAAEEEFYAIYNELNDERDFAVRCFEEKPTGTNIKNQVCRARFVTKAYDRHARRNRNNVTRIANQSADPEFDQRMAEYQQNMETLIAENAELKEALVRYNLLLNQLAAME